MLSYCSHPPVHAALGNPCIFSPHHSSLLCSQALPSLHASAQSLLLLFQEAFTGRQQASSVLPHRPPRDPRCSEGLPRPHPGVQPAWHTELRGPSHFCPSGSALHSFLTLPGLTSSTFTLAGSFSRALTSSMERVRLRVGGSVLPHGQVMIGSLEGLLPPPQPPQRRQCVQSPMPSCSGLL